jgi:hypothetical protein
MTGIFDAHTLEVPAGTPNVVSPEFIPGEKDYQKQKVPFGTTDTSHSYISNEFP